MPRTRILQLLLVVGVTTTLQAQVPASAPKLEPKAETWSDASPHKSGFVTVNGVRLHYLDLGGFGEILMFWRVSGTMLTFSMTLRQALQPTSMCWE